MNARCLDCRFFDPASLPSQVELEGECRRRPPQVGRWIADDEGDPHHGTHDFGTFPKVYASDWCGEFAPADPDDLADRQQLTTKNKDLRQVQS